MKIIENFDGTYSPNSGNLNHITKFFIFLYLSLTSTEFYRNVLEKNIEPSQRHILICCILSGVLSSVQLTLGEASGYLSLIERLGFKTILGLIIVGLQYLVISTLYKLLINIEYTRRSYSISWEQFYRLNVFCLTSIFTFAPAIMLLLGWFGIIICSILFLLSSRKLTPILLEKN